MSTFRRRSRLRARESRSGGPRAKRRRARRSRRSACGSRARRSAFSRGPPLLLSFVLNARDLLNEMYRSELRAGQHRIGADVHVVAVLWLVVPLERRVEVPVLRKRGGVDSLWYL